MDPERQPSNRESILAMALVVLCGGMMLFFLYVVSLGIVGNVLVGVAILGAVGGVHYLVWGRSLSEEVAAEREVLRKKELAESQPPELPAGAIQDLTRVQGIKK